MPRFSVLLPTHNRADVLGVAIASMLAQTERDFELLVVGDGCTDHTAEVVAGFDDPRIRWFDLPKAPFFGYANRNAALRQAQGDLVAFMAHDDIAFPDHLARMGRLFDDPRIAIAHCRALWVTLDGIVVPTAYNLTNPEDRALFWDHNLMPAGCFVHRRACFETAGYWPEDVASAGDWHMWLRIARPDGSNIAYDPVPSQLHFVAIWKKDRASNMPPIARMLPLVDAADWWPAAMKVDVTGAPSEQAAFARRMAEDPGWVDAVKDGTVLVIDRLARDIMDGRATFPDAGPEVTPPEPPPPPAAPRGVVAGLRKWLR